MLAAVPSCNDKEKDAGAAAAAQGRCGFIDGDDGSDEFAIYGSLLDYFDDFNGCDRLAGYGGDVLPDLETDPADLLAEFSCPDAAGDDVPWSTSDVTAATDGDDTHVVPSISIGAEKTTAGEDGESEKKAAAAVDETRSVITSEESATATTAAAAASAQDTRSTSASVRRDNKRSKKPDAVAAATGGKNLQGKKKAKVDWTPELHRRFVQAVEQLGVDKAVPSRILELMGIDCLTRHNVASHLQKYRAHRRHALAREAEAATWSQKRHLHAAGIGAAGHAAPSRWQQIAAPAIGFPPRPPPLLQPFWAPLHVWGHPAACAVDPHRPPPPWMPYPTLATVPGGVVPPNAVMQGVPAPQCIRPPVPVLRFPAPLAPVVPALVPPTAYQQIPPRLSSGDHSAAQQGTQVESQTSKESVDAAIGEVLSKPWLPLPLGLKPPSIDSVMVELQIKGIDKVPPPLLPFVASAAATGELTGDKFVDMPSR